MQLLPQSTKTTYDQALRLRPEATKKVLIRILTDYIHERISWLLKDLGDSGQYSEKIGDNVAKYVQSTTQNLAYDDAKEILLILLKNQRFLNHGNSEMQTGKRKIVEIISGAMMKINLGNPRYDAILKKRVIQIVK